ncbi:nuclear transport factor 2 family protein [Streptomyces tauricus]|uniref:nuclear transport factor 2 family protein n=1 Tax=Streptomyces TaxID=1883 RepID=UPI0033B96A4B
MTSQEYPHPTWSAAVTAVGTDHVRLSYDYRDVGDFDGFGSLLDDDFRFDYPGIAESRGRSAVLQRCNAFGSPPLKHHIHQIVAGGRSVIVLGHLVHRVGRTASDAEDRGDGLDFADHFTISEAGMLLSCCRYYHVSPS